MRQWHIAARNERTNEIEQTKLNERNSTNKIERTNERTKAVMCQLKLNIG